MASSPGRPHARIDVGASGWEAEIPRIVPGERLLIGNLRSTPVTTVEILPA